MKKDMPPIMKTKGLRLVEIGEDEDGAYLKFVATRQKVREVVVRMFADKHIQWTYWYSMYDDTTRTVLTYTGRYGDPTRDDQVKMTGA